MTPQFTVLVSVLFDRLFGESKRWHPLVGFGKFAERIETEIRAGLKADEPAQVVRAKGVLAVLVAIAPFFILATLLETQALLAKVSEIVILYLALGSTSLSEHAQAVAGALEAGDLEEARTCVSKIVSRDTASLNQADVIRATIESVLENGNDAVFAPVFWYFMLGAPGVVLYRLANTLDAMWGYKNERYLHFGWAAARLDDILNWVPARMTALTYTLLGKTRSAWRCWQSQGRLWYSPNAGPVMAAGAGALQVELGGPAVYHGLLKDRPSIGQGRSPELTDVKSAVDLVQNGLLFWVALFVILGGLLHA